MLASGHGQRELVKLLLKHGAKVDLQDKVRIHLGCYKVLLTPCKGRRGHVGNV